MTIGQSDGKKIQDLIRCDCIGECRSSRAVHRGSGDARFGSKPEVRPPARHVRSTLDSRHPQAIPACPFGAKALNRCAIARCAGSPTVSAVTGGKIVKT
jgi:hypothetical protein